MTFVHEQPKIAETLGFQELCIFWIKIETMSNQIMDSANKQKNINNDISLRNCKDNVSKKYKLENTITKAAI